MKPLHAFNFFADTFRIEITRTEKAFVGKGRELLPSPFGSNNYLTVSPKVMHSRLYTSRAMLVGLVHIAGNLYSLLIVDYQNSQATLFLIDGSKLNWSEDSRFKFLSDNWDRIRVYEYLRDGVIRVFTTEMFEPKWIQYAGTNTYLLEYLDRKRKELGSAYPKPSVAVLDDDKAKEIRESYRTVGPRGV